MNYIVYNIDGKMLRQVQCPPKLNLLQAKDGQFVLEGKANDATQKIEFDGLDEKGQPVNPRVVDKTPEELAIETFTGPQLEAITNDQWQKVLSRLSALEKGQ
jgi:hypothetical protein